MQVADVVAERPDWTEINVVIYVND